MDPSSCGLEKSYPQVQAVPSESTASECVAPAATRACAWDTEARASVPVTGRSAPVGFPQPASSHIASIAPNTAPSRFTPSCCPLCM